MNELLKSTARGESVHLKAGEGEGKTALLQEVATMIKDATYTMPVTKKELLTRLAKAMMIDAKGLREFELRDEVIKSLKAKSHTLLIDDSDELTKSVRKLIGKLVNLGLVIVSIGDKKVIEVREVRMNKLKDEELRKIASEYTSDKGLVNELLKECDTPRDLLQGIRNKGVFNKKKKELLPMALLGVIATFMLSLRYWFYMQREFQTGYTVAFIAYLLRALNGLRKM